MTDRDFTRLEYRRTTAWPARIAREWPFLEARLSEGPAEGWVVDLGCGSGEHARHFASRGHAALGCDRSADALLLAREETESAPAAPAAVHWVRADLESLPLRDGCARLALCLGNTLAILAGDEQILAALVEARRILAPDGGLVVQVLDYQRLRADGKRSLPVNLRPEGDRELVYLRLMDFDEPRHVDFHVITIERRAGEEEVRVRRSVRRRLRSLEADELEALLGRAGFRRVRLFGDYAGSAWEPGRFRDVIAVAR